MSGLENTKFTPDARRALSLARDETERLKHYFVGTEHILLGLVKLGQGGAVEVLRKLGVELDAVRVTIEEGVGTGPCQNSGEVVDLTPRTKRAIALAEEEAKSLNHAYNGTGHILLGLLREGGGVAARVLGDLNIRVEDTRRAFIDVAAGKLSGPDSVLEGSTPSDTTPGEKLAPDT